MARKIKDADSIIPNPKGTKGGDELMNWLEGNGGKAKPVLKEGNVKENIWQNKTYSLRLTNIEELDRLAWWSRQKIGDLVDQALAEFLENVKKSKDGYIERGADALEDKKIKELPESEKERRKSHSRRVGRPRKK